MRPFKNEAQEQQRQRAECEKMWMDRMQHLAAPTEAAVNVYDTSSKPANVASAQLMAHFTYLSLKCTLKGSDALKPLTRFGLKWRQSTPRPKPQYGQDLH